MPSYADIFDEPDGENIYEGDAWNLVVLHPRRCATPSPARRQRSEKEPRPVIATVDRRPLVNLDLMRWHLTRQRRRSSPSRCSAGCRTRSSSTTSTRSPGIEWLSPGRVRMVHTNMAAYGFIANAFIAGMLFAIPRLTARSRSSPTGSAG